MHGPQNVKKKSKIFSYYLHPLVAGVLVDGLLLHLIAGSDTYTLGRAISGRGIGPLQKPLPVGHTAFTTDILAPRRNSKPQSQQAIGLRPTP